MGQFNFMQNFMLPIIYKCIVDTIRTIHDRSPSLSEGKNASMFCCKLNDRRDDLREDLSRLVLTRSVSDGS